VNVTPEFIATQNKNVNLVHGFITAQNKTKISGLANVTPEFIATQNNNVNLAHGFITRSKQNFSLT
jgi:hypothetical protein